MQYAPLAVPSNQFRSRQIVYQIGEWHVDPDSGGLIKAREEVRLAPHTMDVLVYLAERPNQVVSIEEMLEALWPGSHTGDYAVHTAISNLRQAFHDDTKQPSYIVTAPRRGYQLIAPVVRLKSRDSILDRSFWTKHSSLLAAFGILLVVLSSIVGYRLMTNPQQGNVVEDSSNRIPIYQQISFSGQVKSARISPDGQFVAYVDEQTNEIIIHDLLSRVDSVVVGPPDNITDKDSRTCFVHGWSPEGTQILASCFAANMGSTFVVPRLGGRSRELFSDASLLTDYGRIFPLFWTDDDQRLAVVPRYNSGSSPNKPSTIIGLFEMQYEPRSSTRLPLDVSLLTNQWVISVSVSPDKHLTIVTRDHTSEKSRIYTARLETVTLEKVFETNDAIHSAVTMLDGQSIIFLHSKGTREQPVVGGAQASMVSRLFRSDPHVVKLLVAGEFTDFSLSNDGKLVVVRNVSSSNLRYAERTVDGVKDPVQLTAGTWHHHRASFSADGRQIAFSRSQGVASNIFTMDVTGKNARQLTFFRSSHSLYPSWSPDGRSIVFTSTEGGGIPHVWTVNADGSNILQVSTLPVGEPMYVNWTVDNQVLYQIPGNQTHRFLDPITGQKSPLFELHELFDGDIVTNTDDPSVGWNFIPKMSPAGSKIALRWNRSPGNGLWIFEKGDTPSEPELVAGIPAARTVYQFVNTKLLYGRRIRVTLVARFQPVEAAEGRNASGGAFAGLRVLPESTPRNRIGAYADFEVRVNHNEPIRGNVWKSFEYEADIPEDGGDLVVSCGLSGEGTAWFDDIELMVKIGDDWKPVEIKNSDFEQGINGDLPVDWSQARPLDNHEVSVIRSLDGRTGNVLKIQSKPVHHRDPHWYPIRWDQSGDSLYVVDRKLALWEYSLADKKLTQITRLTENDDNQIPDISADGRGIVYNIVESQSDVWNVEMIQPEGAEK